MAAESEGRAGGEQGTLYLCATPIGNLEDVTLRLLRVLKEVEVIAAEDTRRARKLLTHYDIHTRVVSCHQHSGPGRLAELARVLQQGGSVAYVSESGTPVISDPGRALMETALEAGARVEMLPGPSAILPAVVLSELPTREFTFAGFPPRKAGRRRKFLERLGALGHTVVFFEAPGRLCRLLEELLELCGERPAAVARELTKVHEEVFRGTLRTCLERYSQTAPRGECVLVVGGGSEARGEEAELDDR